MSDALNKLLNEKRHQSASQDSPEVDTSPACEKCGTTQDVYATAWPPKDEARSDTLLDDGPTIWLCAVCEAREKKQT